MTKVLIIAFCYVGTTSSLPSDLVLADVLHTLKALRDKYKITSEMVNIITDLPLKIPLLLEFHERGQLRPAKSASDVKHEIANWCMKLPKGTRNFFYFTGHGGTDVTWYGRRDSSIFTCSALKQIEKISERDLHSAFAHAKKGVKIMAIFDCCYVGNVLDLKYTVKKPIFKLKKEKRYSKYDADILLLASSSETETSRFMRRGSIFTTLWSDCINEKSKTNEVYMCIGEDMDGRMQSLTICMTSDVGINDFIKR